MRKFTQYCTVILFCSLFYSGTVSAQLQKIYLNPKAAGSAKQSQFIDSIRFIQLEEKEGVELGPYPQITVADTYFIITDRNNKALMLYAKNGTFVKKISYKSLGPSVGPTYNECTNQIVFFGDNKNYTLTSRDVIQIRLDWNNPRNKKYFKRYVIDLDDPSFTIKKDIPTENDISGALPFFDKYYWQGEIITSSLYKDSLDYEIKIYKDNHLVKKFFPYNRINEPRFLYSEESAEFTRTGINKIHYVSRPYCDTIYKMDGDSLFPAYHLVTPLENSIPSFFFSRPFKNKAERENFERNNGWMFQQIYIRSETPTMLFFAVRYLSNAESYFYQKKTGTTYKLKNIKADASSYNLPLLATSNIFQKGDWFYKTQKASDLITFFEKNKNIPVPKELEGFINSNPSSEAQVLVAFKFKN